MEKSTVFMHANHKKSNTMDWWFMVLYYFLDRVFIAIAIEAFAL